MCYIIEYSEQIFASVLQMTVTIEKKVESLERSPTTLWKVSENVSNDNHFQYRELLPLVTFSQPFHNVNGLLLKKDMNIESVNVWITSDYDFLDAVHTEFFQDLMPFHFSASFGGIKATNIIIKVA